MTKRLVTLTEEFVDQLKQLKYETMAPFVYNPLEYAWASHKKYLTKFGRAKKQNIIVGMNPGPYGMAQTGVPFGEVAHVMNWLKIKEPVGKPKRLHPKREIVGFDCQRSEVSGRRLWGFFAEKFPIADDFFKDYFVTNYCPLIFFDEKGTNLTPDKLPKIKSKILLDTCDWYLRNVVEILEAKTVIGVGRFAATQAERACAGLPGITFGHILHPSPANPQANKGWGQVVHKQLLDMGLRL